MYLKCLHSEHVRRSEWQTILYLGDQGHPGGHGSMEGPHPGRSTVGHHLVLIVGGSPIGQVIILLHQLHLHQLRYQVWSYKGITPVHVLDLLMFGFVFSTIISSAQELVEYDHVNTYSLIHIHVHCDFIVNQ